MAFGGTGGTGSLSSDSDVTLNGPVDGQGLVYVGSPTNKWKNATLATAASDVLVDHSASGAISGTVSIDLTQGNYHALKCSGPVTITMVQTTGNWPVGVTYLTLEITSNGYAVTFPAGWYWLGGAFPSLSNSGIDLISVSSRDRGTTVLAAEGKGYAVPSSNFGPTMLSLNPLLYYQTFDGTSLSDQSGNAHTATLLGTYTIGSTLVPSDPTSKSVTLDGTSTYIQEGVGPIPQASTSAGAFSLVFAVSAPDPGDATHTTATQSRLYASCTSSSSGPLFQITNQITSGNSQKLLAYWRDDTGTQVILNNVTCSATVLDGNPHLVAFTYSNGAYNWYVDGGTAVSTGTGTTYASDTFTPTAWAWGALPRSTVSNWFKGSLVPVASFSYALTAQNVASLYSAWSA